MPRADKRLYSNDSKQCGRCGTDFWKHISNVKMACRKTIHLTGHFCILLISTRSNFTARSVQGCHFFCWSSAPPRVVATDAQRVPSVLQRPGNVVPERRQHLMPRLCPLTNTSTSSFGVGDPPRITSVAPGRMNVVSYGDEVISIYPSHNFGDSDRLCCWERRIVDRTAYGTLPAVGQSDFLPAAALRCPCHRCSAGQIGIL